MTIGKSTLWLNSIKDVDKELIKCVERVWPAVISRLSALDVEDKITERLVNILRKERDVWNLGFLDLQFKLREEEKDGDFTTKGIIDIVLFLDNSYQKYIAYEAKRLNTVDSSGKRKASQAGKYLEQGVVRYVTAQYSEKLPYGCMLGYVMDGDQVFAFQQIVSAMGGRKALLNINSTDIESRVAYYTEFETVHMRKSSKTEIVVRHRLFSIPA
ncbi:hypothetical protein FKG94_02555 [Exilibacterium tricleocarpae]|uniref:Uncharacterized protein n=1 Tax=Exilibacterium tricleocarpae TaxID=2591008 RepID=A0A545U8E2_9GAMM|nr:hypothetical protein [Exilibacterium tricleocarpae]TQV85742.1 hypothetical protein FKG94_02555 [Exilibacterium tricleocarpae]